MSTNTAQAQKTDNQQAVKATDHHPAFEWTGSQRIDSLNVTVEGYKHIKTGALHYHIQSDNPENVFMVAFRTVPMDSTGVAHILEHTALCGSKNYPVRDPFFMMIRRSLNTFMNAFTSSDWTAYPFASKNKKDFYNLMDVYLDAAFFTRLDELDFMQEGHRIEFKEEDNSGSELEFKGVVYNEMKGAMSSPVSILWQTLSKHLYPTSTYHYNSGGEPSDIPDLTYEQLRSFHETHYHPSNAVFLTFGDMPARDHQAVFEDRVLSKFERLDINIAVESEKRYFAPMAVTEAYAYDAEDGVENKTHHVMGWLLGKCTSLEEMMRANLLSAVLLDNSSSPLRHILETTKLGSAPSPLCGLEDSNYEMCFLCGIEGSQPENAEAFEQMVFETLSKVANEGVPQEQLESVLHQLELSQREIGGDGFPYGLQLILEGLTAAIHRSDPAALLNLDPVIEQLREQIKDPEFIKRLVKELLIDNQHRVRLTMVPDTKLSQRRKQAEKDRLAEIRSTLTDEDVQTLVDRAKQLAERQMQEDDPGLLPKVDLDDVPPEVDIPESEQHTIAGSDAAVFKLGTNGLVYHEVVYDLPQLPGELLELLPHYSSCLTELGVGAKDYLEVQAWQSSVTGGVSGRSSIRGQTDDVQAAHGFYLFSGKALERNNIPLAELMHETMQSVRFDELERIQDLISQKRARREQSITGNGHTLAMTAASSGMSSVAALGHRFSGLQGIHRLKQLDDSIKDQQALTEFAEQLSQIHQSITASPRQYMIAGEQDKMDEIIDGFATVWSKSDRADIETFSLQPVSETVKQFWVTNTQVNFCARAYPTVPMEHEHAAALSVLGGFLRNGFLHTAIREKGGAYGGGSGHDTNTAAFRFFSYRDPRLQGTLDDFDQAIDWLLSGSHEWRQVEEAILGVIGTMDKPGSPAGEASHAFHDHLHGRTREKLQAFRQNVLAVTLDDLRNVAETYLRPERASTAVITSSTMLEQVDTESYEVINL